MRTSSRLRPSLVLVLGLAMAVSLPSACKKESDAEKPDAGGGVIDGVADDVDREVKGADESFDKAVEDVKGAGKDVGEAFSSDDDDDSQSN
ncbi:MAG: hypothetical protein R3B09_05970 [Nannocystaceae bacterium]